MLSRGYSPQTVSDIAESQQTEHLQQCIMVLMTCPATVDQLGSFSEQRCIKALADLIVTVAASTRGVAGAVTTARCLDTVTLYSHC